MTGQERDKLISDAAEAIELFGEDELERFAEEQRRKEADNHTDEL